MRYHTFLRQSTYRRYAIFIATILFSWYGIQAYINNKSIDIQIQEVESTIQDLEEKTAYMEKFYSNYLRSPYASYFVGHENGILYRGERVVRLKNEVLDDEVGLPLLDNEKEKVILSTPEESWQYFIQQNFPFLGR